MRNMVRATLLGLVLGLPCSQAIAQPGSAEQVKVRVDFAIMAATELQATVLPSWKEAATDWAAPAGKEGSELQAGSIEYGQALTLVARAKEGTLGSYLGFDAGDATSGRLLAFRQKWTQDVASARQGPWPPAKPPETSVLLELRPVWVAGDRKGVCEAALIFGEEEADESGQASAAGTGHRGIFNIAQGRTLVLVRPIRDPSLREPRHLLAMIQVTWSPFRAGEGEGPPRKVEPKPPESAAASLLQCRVTVKLERVPLTTVLSELNRQLGKVDTVVMYGQLATQPVPLLDVNFADTTLENVLKAIAGKLNLRYRVEGQKVLLFAPGDEAPYEFRTYRVSDLFFDIREDAVFEKPWLASYIGDSAVEGEKAFKGSSSLIACIQDHIAPETWETRHGKGVIQYQPPLGSLIVWQTESVHNELKEFLDSVRASDEKEK